MGIAKRKKTGEREKRNGKNRWKSLTEGHSTGRERTK